MDMSDFLGNLGGAVQTRAYGTQPRPSVTDTSVQVTGGVGVGKVNGASNANAGVSAKSNLHLSLAIVAFAYIALWALGGLVFKA